IRDDLVTGVQTCALPIFTEGKCYSPAYFEKRTGENIFAIELERMEAESCGVCDRAGGAGAFSYLFSGFFRADISGDQRFAADRAVHPASGADAALCVDGGAGVGPWMLTSFFHGGT